MQNKRPFEHKPKLINGAGLRVVFAAFCPSRHKNAAILFSLHVYPPGDGSTSRGVLLRPCPRYTHRVTMSRVTPLIVPSTL